MHAADKLELIGPFPAHAGMNRLSTPTLPSCCPFPAHAGLNRRGQLRTWSSRTRSPHTRG